MKPSDVDDLDLAAALVARQFPILTSDRLLTPLGNRGGFSGARLWHIHCGLATFCLRAWPPGEPTPGRLRSIHSLQCLARQVGLDFVPSPLLTADGASWIDHAGRLWELTHWLPGQADFHRHPSTTRLESACTALARLHVCWETADSQRGPCPAVHRRLDAVREWKRLLASGWRPRFEESTTDPIREPAEQAWQLLPRFIDEVPSLLSSWLDRPVSLQPCLCDVWHDHVLFEGDRVSGIVDYGAVKMDHVAVDLARLLGSFIRDDTQQWQTALAAYRRMCSLSDDEAALAVILDRTGTIVALLTWVRWLYYDGRVIEDQNLVARRLSGLVRRLAQHD